ncbi:MAG: hypothetical protein ABII18_05165 [bacterium]|nr:hypothetical protein [bacterium]MBU1918944.1 hypothetical protein [bacterium]
MSTCELNAAFTSYDSAQECSQTLPDTKVKRIENCLEYVAVPAMPPMDEPACVDAEYSYKVVETTPAQIQRLARSFASNAKEFLSYMGNNTSPYALP